MLNNEPHSQVWVARLDQVFGLMMLRAQAMRWSRYPRFSMIIVQSLPFG